MYDNIKKNRMGLCMKLRCVDGVVREFEKDKEKRDKSLEVHCKICKTPFGAYTIDILKPILLNHSCYSEYLKVTPCPRRAEDEVFRFGLYAWNVTKMYEYAQQNLIPTPMSYEDVKNYHDGFMKYAIRIDEGYLNQVDITKPGLLVRLSDYSNESMVVDGNHRLARAYRFRKGFRVYVLSFGEQIRFLCYPESLQAIIKYNNDTRLMYGVDLI